MKMMKTMKDLETVELKTEMRTIITNEMTTILSGETYKPENDGHLLLIEPMDSKNTILQGIGAISFPEIMWEGMRRDIQSKCYVGVILRNNQFTITVVIPENINCKALLNSAKKELT